MALATMPVGLTPTYPGRRLTSLSPTLYEEVVEVHIPAQQELNFTTSPPKPARGLTLLQQAVAQVLAENEWFAQQLKVGVDQICCGDFIEEEELVNFGKHKRWDDRRVLIRLRV
jgi:hypothetical protein